MNRPCLYHRKIRKGNPILEPGLEPAEKIQVGRVAFEYEWRALCVFVFDHNVHHVAGEGWLSLLHLYKRQLRWLLLLHLEIVNMVENVLRHCSKIGGYLFMAAV